MGSGFGLEDGVWRNEWSLLCVRTSSDGRDRGGVKDDECSFRDYGIAPTKGGSRI